MEVVRSDQILGIFEGRANRIFNCKCEVKRGIRHNFQVFGFEQLEGC